MKEQVGQKLIFKNTHFLHNAVITKVEPTRTWFRLEDGHEDWCDDTYIVGEVQYGRAILINETINWRERLK